MKAMYWMVAGGVVLSSAGFTAPVLVGGAAVNGVSVEAPVVTHATVVDAALAVNAETGEFSTLLAAVITAGLVDALSADGQRTVFAPTDAAFAKLGLDANNVREVPVEALTEILLYHVASGRLSATDVVSSERVEMLNGEAATIRVGQNGAYIDGARIVATDVEAGNGLIHVIDAVLVR
jgi:transforming growth factor-beta-induced protein